MSQYLFTSLIDLFVCLFVCSFVHYCSFVCLFIRILDVVGSLVIMLLQMFCRTC